MTQIVWFKRDLRIADHLPLTRAAAAGSVIPLYVVEPQLWRQPDRSGRQWAFLYDCLQELREELAALGMPLVVRTGSVLDVLAELHHRIGIDGIWSHQETGSAWTYERDKAVAGWVRARGVPWTEVPQHGVIRGLKTRDGWARKWDAFMRRPITPAPAQIRGVAGVDPGTIPDADALRLPDDPCPGRQPGGRSQARALLASFLEQRGAAYHKEMSSPLTAAESCSRLSVHLAAGSLSMREAAQAAWRRLDEVRALPRAERGGWGAALNAYIGRLHWHCHFIQKLEDAPGHEFRNVHSGYNGLREGTFDEARFAAWATGGTGFPFVDACMRSLQATGWINFRMRAMLTAFAAYHLWLHWRETGLQLARLFTDYEPGIHWNQVQMQSGTTGINTVRIYNPVKQSYDQDPEGSFIKRWVPELRGVPQVLIHEPWRLGPMEQDAARCRLGVDYPERIVDHMSASRSARERIYAIRRTAAFRQEAAAIQSRHGSRKSGLPQRGGRSRARKRVGDGVQPSLDL
ncbi:MAG: deoxyribodipyrimidine photo-lyase [Alphaproteobacteria bacterium]|nr:deoxyribodipyrimidine photo-lyase [Alphaproteobacteria bacterium]